MVVDLFPLRGDSKKRFWKRHQKILNLIKIGISLKYHKNSKLKFKKKIYLYYYGKLLSLFLSIYCFETKSKQFIYRTIFSNCKYINYIFLVYFYMLVVSFIYVICSSKIITFIKILVDENEISAPKCEIIFWCRFFSLLKAIMKRFMLLFAITCKNLKKCQLIVSQ